MPVLITLFMLFSCLTTGNNQSAVESAVGPNAVLNDGGTDSSEAYDSRSDNHSGEESLYAHDNSDTKASAAGKSNPSADQKADSAESLLPPLSNAEFKARVKNMMPWNMTAVTDGGSPMLIIHDLDKNGYSDALVVAVEGSENVDSDFSELSKSARLFQSGRPYTRFMLLIFYQYSGEVLLRYTVPVAEQLVLSSVEPFDVKKGSDFPYALEFGFRTRSGIEKEIVILSGYGITHFSIQENLSEITLVEDIDDDGYRDIIVHEQGFEEGTGFETFLTWYKWNRLEYTEYKHTNIVRNLRQFFIVSAEYLRAGEYSDFLSYTIEPETLKQLQKSDMTEKEILHLVFLPIDSGPESVPDSEAADFFADEGFSSVVFPEIMETPFSYKNRNDFRHRVSVRFRPPGAESRIFLAEIRMKKNPFQEKQYCFTVDSFD